MRRLVLTSRFKRSLRKFVKRDQDLGKQVEVALQQMEADVFVQSLALDVAELFEEPEAVQYPTDRKRKSSEPEAGSLVGAVDKDDLLNWLDQVAAEQALDEAQMTEQIRELAHGENVEEWSRAIAQYLQPLRSNIRLPDLQQALEMPMVELWLGLLMGGYSLDQQGEFYDSQNLWIMDGGEEA